MLPDKRQCLATERGMERDRLIGDRYGGVFGPDEQFNIDTNNHYRHQLHSSYSHQLNRYVHTLLSYTHMRHTHTYSCISAISNGVSALFRIERKTIIDLSRYRKYGK